MWSVSVLSFYAHIFCKMNVLDLFGSSLKQFFRISTNLMQWIAYTLKTDKKPRLALRDRLSNLFVHMWGWFAMFRFPFEIRRNTGKRFEQFLSRSKLKQLYLYFVACIIHTLHSYFWRDFSVDCTKNKKGLS